MSVIFFYACRSAGCDVSEYLASHDHWRSSLLIPMSTPLFVLVLMKSETTVYWKKKKSSLLSKPSVWSVSDFSFSLASAYELRWPVLSLTISSSHWQCIVSVLIIAELARGRRWSRNLEPNFCPGLDLIPEPLDWQSSTLLTKPPSTPVGGTWLKSDRSGKLYILLDNYIYQYHTNKKLTGEVKRL